MRRAFISGRVWADITAHCRDSASAHAAIAYVSDGAVRRLPLKRGSVLVVDMSQQAVKSGVTNPSEIKKYLARGVAVYTYQGLHSKAVAFDDVAVCGSANNSASSAQQLEEACLVTSDRAVIQKIRAYVESLCAYRITPSVLAKALSSYRRPKGGQGKAQEKAGQEGTTWLVGVVSDTEYSPDEEAVLESGREVAMERKRTGSEYSLQQLRMPIPRGSALFRKVKVGDLLVQVEEARHGHSVIRPSRVLWHRRMPKQGETVGTILFHLESDESRNVPWSKVAATLKRSGYPSVKPDSMRAVMRMEAVRGLMALWL